MKNKLKTNLMTAAGFLLLGLGAVGLLLPVWPTTPFVLASLGCFSANSAVRARILQINFVREYSENYKNRLGLTKKTVIISLVFLWGMLALSAILMKSLWLSALLFAVGAAVTAHILYIARAKKKGE